MPTAVKIIVAQDYIERKIVYLREKKVIFDFDLAELYGVETKQLKRAVNRNKTRFPDDFMIKLTKNEYVSLRSQFGTLKRGKHIKYLPYAFSEQGVAMLSSVLNSERAIQVNIEIMRVFTKIREMLMSHRELKEKIEIIEKKYDYQFKVVFDAIKRLVDPPVKKKQPIGFHVK